MRKVNNHRGTSLFGLYGYVTALNRVNGIQGLESKKQGIFDNYSLSLNGLLTQRPRDRVREELLNCFSKIQLAGQKYRDKTTLANYS